MEISDLRANRSENKLLLIAHDDLPDLMIAQSDSTGDLFVIKILRRVI